MGAHSNILAPGIPWREEPGGLQSMGLQRVGHNWATNTDMHTHTHTHYYIRQNEIFSCLKDELGIYKSIPRVQIYYHLSMKNLEDNWYYDGKPLIKWSGI